MPPISTASALATNGSTVSSNEIKVFFIVVLFLVTLYACKVTKITAILKIDCGIFFAALRHYAGDYPGRKCDFS